MAGIDDNMAVSRDWVPPSPSSRTFYALISGDYMSSREPPSETVADGRLLGSQEQMTSGNAEKMNMMQAGAVTDFGPFSEHKSRLAARAGFNAPRLNTESIRTSDLSLNPDIRSPYLTIPPGLSPTTLLESPVFLSNSRAQPSPTTGKFSFIPNGNGKRSAFISEAPDKSKANIFEDINSSFAFKPVAESGSSSLGTIKKQSFPSTEVSVQTEISHQPQNGDAAKVHSEFRNSISLQTDFSRATTEKDNVCNTSLADQRVLDTVGGSPEHSRPLDEQQDEEGDQRGSGDSMVAGAEGASSEDGYNWRKYGQKQVKSNEYPRSYYKCTHPNCQVKKKVERSHEGHITEIIYKGAHNHPKPPPNRRSTVGSNPLLDMQLDIPEQAGLKSGGDGNPIWANTQKGAASGTLEWRHDNFEATSSASVAPEYCKQSSSLPAQNGTPFESGDAVDTSSTFSNDEDEDDRATHCNIGYDGEEDESESKRRKLEAYATEMSGATRAIREPRVVVQTTSEVDILDDGYRWRKYGQKVVKGNPNPRSYYKCTSAGCTVRKHVERASHDLKSVITTYEGKHKHDIPAARNISHLNSSSSSAVAAHAAAAGQIHRPQQSQLHNSMARFDRPAAFGTFRVPGRQQLGPSPGFSFGMQQPGLASLAMAGLGPGQSELRVLPVYPYLAQQRQVNERGFTMPKGEPKVEPMSEPGMNMSNRSAVYQQLISRLPLGPHM